MGNLNNPAKYALRYRAPIILDQIPVQNTWYTVCNLTGGIEIYLIWLEQDNDATDNKTCQIRATVDGEVWAAQNVNVTWGDLFTVFMDEKTDITDAVPTISISNAKYGFGWRETDSQVASELGSIRMKYGDIFIEIQMTSAVGVNPALRTRTFYSQKALA